MYKLLNIAIIASLLGCTTPDSSLACQRNPNACDCLTSQAYQNIEKMCLDDCWEAVVLGKGDPQSEWTELDKESFRICLRNCFMQECPNLFNEPMNEKFDVELDYCG